MIARQVIKETYEPAPEFFDPGEGVSFATDTPKGRFISWLKLQPDQPKVSFGCIQHRG
jgi:hypothetical protein